MQGKNKGGEWGDSLDAGCQVLRPLRTHGQGTVPGTLYNCNGHDMTKKTSPEKWTSVHNHQNPVAGFFCIQKKGH